MGFRHYYECECRTSALQVEPQWTFKNTEDRLFRQMQLPKLQHIIYQQRLRSSGNTMKVLEVQGQDGRSQGQGWEF